MAFKKNCQNTKEKEEVTRLFTAQCSALKVKPYPYLKIWINLTRADMHVITAVSIIF